jgi:hypothetical protein
MAGILHKEIYMRNCSVVRQAIYAQSGHYEELGDKEQ